MTEQDADILVANLTIFRPSEVVEICVGDLSAPIQTGVELSKLAVLEKNILADLLSHSERTDDGKLILHPEALSWAKELRMLYKDIHDLTRGPQEKMIMKQMDIVGSIYSKIMKDKKPEEIIETIRALKGELKDGGG